MLSLAPKKIDNLIRQLRVHISIFSKREHKILKINNRFVTQVAGM